MSAVDPPSTNDVITAPVCLTAATLTDTDLRRATTGTIRCKLITVPWRVATSARQVTLHLPTTWPCAAMLTPTSSPTVTGGRFPCEGEVATRLVAQGGRVRHAEPEHEDYLRAQIAHR